MRAHLLRFIAAFLVVATSGVLTSDAQADPPYVYADSLTEWSFLGDLNGDGLDEVVQETYSDSDVALAGTSLAVLDGRTGRLLWQQSRAAHCLDSDCPASVLPEVRLLSRGHSIASVLVSWAGLGNDGTDVAISAYQPLTGLSQWAFAVPRPRGCGSAWEPGVTGVADLGGDAVDDVVVATLGCEHEQRNPAYVIDGSTGKVMHAFLAHWPVPVAGLLGPRRPAGLIDAPLFLRGRQRAVVTARDATGRSHWSRLLPRLVGGVGLSPAAVDLTHDGVTDVLVSGHDRASLHPYYVGAIDGRTGRVLFHRQGLFGFSEVLAAAHPARIVFTAIKTDCTKNCAIYDVLDNAGRPVWALGGHAYALPTGDVDSDGVLDVRIDTKAGVVRSGADGHVIVAGTPRRAWDLTSSLDGRGDDVLVTRHTGDDSVVTARDGRSLDRLWRTELTQAHGLGFQAAGGPSGSVLATWGYDGRTGAAVLAANDGHVLWRTEALDAGVSD